MNKIFNYILWGNVDKNFYTRNYVQLNERNYGTLVTTYTFSTCMCAFLFILTYLVNLIGNLTVFYGIYVLWFCVCTLIIVKVIKNHKEYCRIMFYLFAASLLYMVAYIGTVISYDMYAVTFFVFIMFVPSLYVDKPSNSIILTIIATLLFCVMVLLNKTDPRIIQNDLLNALCVCIVSIGYGVYTTNVNLENIQAAIILKEQSNIDELTLLPNRRWFNKCIVDIYDNCSSEGLNIYMMDVDYFKLYNDTYGHLKGDECLAIIGRELDKCVKKLDVFVSRYGGEEFIIIDDRHSADEMKNIAERIVKDIESLHIKHESTENGYVTISMGYVNSKECNSSTYMQLINFADEAMYKAKNKGRNRAEAYISNNS
ncbi:GGDEF domain-containing protein [Anaerorhabdus sp.]|jgi:diguanylate cyclase (GGDEF)-like protein|uniref:GGDEF domain-containing protein n=1 Tax=Anaerorhabdus sp. TaxID=1872524 RepID=UPI002FCA9067